MIDMQTYYPDDPMPLNPLWEKWKEKYSLRKRICDGYSCMFCGDCPSGDYWKCPEEDRAVYDEYMERRKAWEERHPDYMNVLMSQEIEIEIAVKGEGA